METVRIVRIVLGMLCNLLVEVEHDRRVFYLAVHAIERVAVGDHAALAGARQADHEDGDAVNDGVSAMN